MELTSDEEVENLIKPNATDGGYLQTWEQGFTPPSPFLLNAVQRKVKVKKYLFMKYNKKIQNLVFQEKIFKNLQK